MTSTPDTDSEYRRGTSGPAFSSDPLAADHSSRRRAAEAAARAAEERATAAADAAKAAIAAAARAAADADAAAVAAEQAEAAVAEAAAAEAREAENRGPSRHGAADHGGYDDADEHGTDQFHAVNRYGVVDQFAAEQEPVTGRLPAVRFPDDQGPGTRHRVPAESAAQPVSGRRRAPEPGTPQDAASGADPQATAVIVPSPRRRPAPDPAPQTGRAARRRAAAADTAVFSAVRDGEAAPDSDPTRSGDAAADGEGAPARRRTAARAARAATAASDGVPKKSAPKKTAPEKGASKKEAPKKAAPAAPRRGFRSKPVLVAAAAGGVIALAGVLVVGSGGTSTPQPAAVVESQLPAVPQLPSAAMSAPDSEDPTPPGVGDVDPLSDRAVGFLRALRAAGVPTSRGGLAETEAASLVCEELADGVSEERIARALPASLPTVSRRQAAELIDVAQENYCR